MDNILPIIDFSCNWNGKLFCTAFTAIRLRDDSLYRPGALFEQTLKFKSIGTVEVLEVKHFMLNQLNDFMAFLEFGINKKEAIKLIQNEYPNETADSQQQFSYILLRRTQPDILLIKEIEN